MCDVARALQAPRACTRTSSALQMQTFVLRTVDVSGT